MKSDCQKIWMGDFEGKEVKIGRSFDAVMVCQFRGADFSRGGRGERWRNKTFSECDFTEADLTGVHAYGCRFEWCDFVRTRLAEFGMGSGRKPSVYEHCLFQEVKLQEVERCAFIDCRFVNCDFEGVDFGWSYFRDVVFMGEVANCVFGVGEATRGGESDRMEGVSFEEAVLRGVRFGGGVGLDGVGWPKRGVYAYFSNFRTRCDSLIGQAESRSVESEELKRFWEIFARDERQRTYLINLEELTDSLGFQERTIRLIWDCADWMLLDGEKLPAMAGVE
ncbi:pentapeptide repeat-containing protein [uncultured Rikenella sp.]|uniref:pentapeptide repeat-containing protein n=1 Tax=uncultured Rikenella sp. TaxID=368003 RepID=UPI00272DBFD5|nr:pentapeptide repeat-containing protein [uncultured Rikenella sp.]